MPPTISGSPSDDPPAEKAPPQGAPNPEAPPREASAGRALANEVPRPEAALDYLAPPLYARGGRAARCAAAGRYRGWSARRPLRGARRRTRPGARSRRRARLRRLGAGRPRGEPDPRRRVPGRTRTQYRCPPDARPVAGARRRSSRAAGSVRAAMPGSSSALSRTVLRAACRWPSACWSPLCRGTSTRSARARSPAA